MSRPCSQLNSKRLKDLLQCKILPIVQSTCSVISVKCVWRIAEEDNAQAWKLVCEKRDECDKTLGNLRDVSFFFSAISTAKYAANKGSGKGRKRPREEHTADEEEDGLDAVLSQDSRVILSNDKKLLPAVSYWIACQTRNGAAASTRSIQAALLKCDVEVTLTRTTSNRDSDTLSKLCQVIKDHKNPCMVQLVSASYHQCLRNLRASVTDNAFDDSDGSDLEMGDPDKVVRLKVAHQTFAKQLSEALGELRKAGLQIDDNLNLDSDDETTLEVPSKPLSCPVTILCHDIELVMKKLGYALHRGDIYNTVKGSRYSYGHMCSVKTFLHSLMGNHGFKDRLVKHIQRVLPILSDPDNCVIRQLMIDRDLVEVNDGWCWSFKQRKFLQDAVKDADVGCRSPRAFVPYQHDKEPEPKYFESILRNSLNQEEITRFCGDFLGLFSPKGHKEPVPCMIGTTDSGKTSLFAPIFQIVPLSRIARVTKQKAFNKAMITPGTEIIFLDEAYTELMDPDDWKLLTQGGYVCHDTKWNNPKGFLNHAPMFITFQVDPDFGPQHNEAMGKRLHKYHLKSLPTVVQGANHWLTRHAMDCIVWASLQVEKPRPGHSEVRSDSESDVLAEGLNEDELSKIMTATLDTESECEQSCDMPQTNEAEMDSDDEESSIGRIKRQMKENEPGTLRRRQLDYLLDQAEQTRARALESRERRLQERRTRLNEFGVLEYGEEETICDPDAPLPTQVRIRLQERKLALLRNDRVKKAKEAFSNPWISNKERELANYTREKSTSNDAETRRTFQSLIDITTNKMCMYHDKNGTKTEEGLIERKKLCIKLGLLTESMSSMVRDVVSPLPEIVAPEEEADILSQLHTPPSSQPKNRPHRKRARKSQVPSSQPMRGQSVLTSFFKSQR